MNALGIGEKTIHYTLNRDKTYDTQDKRGKHKKRGTNEKEKNYVRQHIGKFKTIESH